MLALRADKKTNEAGKASKLEARRIGRTHIDRMQKSASIGKSEKKSYLPSPLVIARSKYLASSSNWSGGRMKEPSALDSEGPPTMLISINEHQSQSQY